MRCFLYILSGASGCGKTTLLNNVASINKELVDPVIKAIRAPKYSERLRRISHGDGDDIIHVDKIAIGEYDIAYNINGVTYGIKVKEIKKLLNEGYNPFIVLSDFRIIRQLKQALGDCVKALYVTSAIDADKLRRIQVERLGFRPTNEQKEMLSYHFSRTSAAARLGWWERVSDCMANLEKDWHTYATDARSTEIRAQKIRTFHIRYIDQLNLFDHVILNYSENKPQEMSEQIYSIIEHQNDQNINRITPPIFVIAAASGAGKGILMETLHLIGRNRVSIVSKLAKREPKEGDRIDGMIALNQKLFTSDDIWPEWWTKNMKETAIRGNFPDEYDMKWKFHSGTEYAVSSHEINSNLAMKKPQILVSNIDQFDQFQLRWPQHVVFIYLHRLSSDEENREFQRKKWEDNLVEAEARIAEREKVHASYIKNIYKFDHVLLNTSHKEDLYDQMFCLLDVYE